MFDPHEFWKDPAGSSEARGMVATCRPEFYLDLENVTRLWVETMQKYAGVDDTILEIGCGTGRNLAGLLAAGYTRLHGLELNANAVKLGREKWPELLDVPIVAMPVERMEMVPYDVIYTSGVLMHLPPDSEWVFDQIKRAARKVIMTVEGEGQDHRHVWGRNYREVFEDGEWVQAEKELCGAYPPLPDTTVKRVFVKR